MAGGGTIPIEAAGLAVGRRHPPAVGSPVRHLAAFAGLPHEAPDLFPGTVPRILALDVDQERIPAMVGNLRAAGLTGPAHEDSIVIGQQDVRDADAGRRRAHAARRARHEAGRVLLQPAVRRAHRREAGEEQLLALYADMGRAFARFSGWRAACFVANPKFVYAFGTRRS